jgi:dihydrofolate synthase / folylpolyglutamate synthase
MTNAVLARLLEDLTALHTQEIDLNLVRVERLMEKLGNPHLRLPPVFHVAGTNGKGSTVAYLRACLEATGKRVHVYTSPHLVRFNERIRVTGQYISDDDLISVLRDVRSINGDDPITFFEVTTAAAFLAFTRVPADAVVLEVGMGGRLDATNIVPRPAVCGIAQLAIDHQQFLGSTLVKIAAEKAAIAKKGAALVHQKYDAMVTQKVTEVASLAGAKTISRGVDWDCALYQGHLHYKDSTGKLELPLPRIVGAHQLDNAALAIAMLRHQNEITVPESAIRAGLGWAEWPARLQRLSTGALAAMIPDGAQLWLDGGHNPAAAKALAAHFTAQNIKPVLITAMLANKDAVGFFKAFEQCAAQVIAMERAADDHSWHSAKALAATAAAIGLASSTTETLHQAITQALKTNGPAATILICGSLYFAGEILSENGTLPV